MKYMGFISLFFALVLVGCDNGTSNLETISWQLKDDGFVQWYTNDSYYLSSYSWSLYDNDNGPNTYEIECKKISGANSWAYGMIFGASDSVNDEWYSININVDGWFCVAKNYASNLIKNWEESSNLNTGYNTTNVIKVTKSGTTYTVYLNNIQVYEFTDASITGSRIGYLVFVGDEANESFPDIPVDVRFKQK